MKSKMLQQHTLTTMYRKQSPLFTLIFQLHKMQAFYSSRSTVDVFRRSLLPP